MQDYEKLGAFYLGRPFDPKTQRLSTAPLLYDARDLTTHAVIVGMTGSGKTGLGIGLLEEALIDSIPVIAIDPKGDLPNLMLQFPQLAPEDFQPWIDPREALAKGQAPEAFAAVQTERWRKGLAEWDQQPERIARLRDAAEVALYTPGSRAGRPVSALRAFSAPAAEVRNDTDLLRERIQTTATSLLALVGIEADPVTSREHILVSSLLAAAWEAGQNPDLAALIRAIQQPPFARVGVMELELFYPAQERFALAMRLNNLLAAPGFAAWMEGEPLDVGRLLWTAQGKPRAAIFSIGHLGDAERMFFVTMLLSEVLAWVRTQPGTASLRALLYFDEVLGFLPPVANPPSKGPLLTLLKQARAFGLGLVLATQNPVDLDYKALANAGTWFIGRLQTERDQQRLMEGLMAAAAGARLDRAELERTLAGLAPRTFWLHNVHDPQPALFQTRWTLSYLAGPVSREGIARLCAGRQPAAQPAVPAAGPAAGPELGGSAPVLPPGVEVYFLPASGAGQGLNYLPSVAGEVEVHYSNSRMGVALTQAFTLAAALEQGMAAPDWSAAEELAAGCLEPDQAPLSGASFAPAGGITVKAVQAWQKDLARWVRQNRPLTIFKSQRLGQTSQPGEEEGAFRARLTQALREQRDLEIEKLRAKYAERAASLQARLQRAQQSAERQSAEATASKIDTAISFGTAILGAFLGRRAISVGSTSRVGSAMKSASRMQREHADVTRAQESVAAVQREIAELEAGLQQEIATRAAGFDPAAEPLEALRVAPRVQDVTVRRFGVAWLPYRQDAGGRLTPDWRA
jgi:hypothetical protein